jgi:hypothetical protein
MKIHTRAPGSPRMALMPHLQDRHEEAKADGVPGERDWLGNLPDLNPIENCWSYMKYKLKSDQAVTFLPEMILSIRMMWVKVKDMPLEYFRKLCDSMPSRIE